MVLAVKGTGAEGAVTMCGAAALAGKTVMDATNPISDDAPDDGVLHYFTDIDKSLMEKLQELARTRGSSRRSRALVARS